MLEKLNPDRTAEMRALSADDRRDAIAASGNVIGVGRFGRAAKLTDLAAAYPVSIKPEPA